VVLSQRERYIAVALGAVLLLVILWTVVFSPLEAWREQIGHDKEAQIKQQQLDERLFADQKRLQKVWDEMQKGGLMDNPYDAQTQLHQAVTDWAVQSGVNVSNQTTEAPIVVGDQKSGFVQAGIKVVGFGTTSGIAKLIYQIEVAKIPARVHLVTISSKKEGADDLQVDMNLTTLCVTPVRQTGPNPVQVSPTANPQ